MSTNIEKSKVIVTIHEQVHKGSLFVVSLHMIEIKYIKYDGILLTSSPKGNETTSTIEEGPI